MTLSMLEMRDLFAPALERLPLQGDSWHEFKVYVKRGGGGLVMSSPTLVVQRDSVLQRPWRWVLRRGA